ncbi:MAG: methyltransferase [Cytophagaceae bacterium]|jgi:release factor glutamine methyltransferase|nr:methyltransferase [Cytophagaceae bacterium]
MEIQTTGKRRILNWKKKITDWCLKPLVKIYLSRQTSFRYQQLRMRIFPGVFHPQFFFSSTFLADFISELPLQGKSFCEPCSGSGLLAILARKRGAKVVCFDISERAVANISENARLNDIQVGEAGFLLYLSDGFSQVPSQSFDYLVINPPYFFHDPQREDQYAWYAGSEGQFFHRFFSALHSYTHLHSQCFMVLADNCELERIQGIAAECGWKLDLVREKRIWWEMNYIFHLRKA